MEVDRRSTGRTESRQNCTEGHLAASKGDWRWWKVSWLHKSWRKFSRLHRKFLEVDGMSPVTRKVIGRSSRRIVRWQKFKEGRLATRKVHGCCRKDSRPHRMLTDVYIKSPSCMEFDESGWKISLQYQKLTVVDGRFQECTESRGKMTEGPSTAQKVEGSWWKVPQAH